MDGAYGVEMSDDYASYSNAPSSDMVKGDILPVAMSWKSTANRYSVLRKQADATVDLLCNSSDSSDSKVEIHCAFINQVRQQQQQHKEQKGKKLKAHPMSRRMNSQNRWGLKVVHQERC